MAHLYEIGPVKSSLEADNKKVNYYIIHVRGRVKWILPEKFPNSVKILYARTPYKITAKIKWCLLIVLHRLGMLKYLPFVEKIVVHKPGISYFNQYFHWQSSTVPYVVIYIGDTNPFQKIVALFVDEANVKMVVKIPLGLRASYNVQHEYSILKQLSEKKITVVPTPLWYDKKTKISAQTSLKGKMTDTHFTKYHINFLKLLHTGNMTTIEEQFIKLKKTFLQLDGASQALKQSFLNAETYLTDNQTIPEVISHGDFAPWNLLADNNVLNAYDFEEACLNSFIGYDCFHFFVMQSFVFHIDNIYSVILKNKLVAQYFSEFCISEEQIQKLFLLYLLFDIIKRVILEEYDYQAYLINKIEQHLLISKNFS